MKFSGPFFKCAWLFFMMMLFPHVFLKFDKDKSLIFI
jgi:hypothetical protein